VNTGALLTDLYELTMAAAYLEAGKTSLATFELFVRQLPPRRRFLIVAGLEQALQFLQNLHFDAGQIDFLRAHPAFRHVTPRFFEYLASLRFNGEVWAMPEGTVAFANEPLLRVTAPIVEAQIAETFLLATINFQTMIATKAARVVAAARGRPVIEFGSRRAHGPEAGMLAARAAYLGGCSGTSNVEAGRRFGVPIVGTMAHSFVMAFEDEPEAFEVFLRTFPETATILLDTYDVATAVRALAGKRVPAVRLDSGDLLAQSKQVRRLLDEAGMTQTKIFASGDLNEERIVALLDGGAPIDAFGVGTELSTSADAPVVNGVYKLVAISGGRIKLSPGKETYPGPKQVWRQRDAEGRYVRDRIAGADEQRWQPLLVPVTVAEPLAVARARAAEELKRLPDGDYPVEFSRQLQTERNRLEREIFQRRIDRGGCPE